MKAIISHDVDHLTTKEHLFTDAYIPKLIIRSTIELLKRKISIVEYLLRIKEIFSNKLQYISELMDFDRNHNVKSTFFFGMDNALGLSYSREAVYKWIQLVQASNYFEVGIHGIDFNNLEKMKEEYKKFKEISGEDNFGIRMHYLRSNGDTLNFLNECGYKFDSTVHSLEQPYLVGGMWEFPLHMMDVTEFRNQKSLSRNEIKEIIENRVNQIFESGVEILNINFHDRYFSKAYSNYFNWYVLLVKYLKEIDCQFITFDEAISILEENNISN